MSNTERKSDIKTPYNIFEKMISITHLFDGWDHFIRGKRKRKDIQHFSWHLEDHLFKLHRDLCTLNYKHGAYEQFRVSDPKDRLISKAPVRDRFVHHIVHFTLRDLFDSSFIFHSLSSRLGKGIHLGIQHLERMIRKVSCNGHKPCYALKMDIKRFFDSINHQTLKTLLCRKIRDDKMLFILNTIIDSFSVTNTPQGNAGIPLGNVTSQIFANIYLHELDLFVKQNLRQHYFLRYCDDFIIVANDATALQKLISVISEFLLHNLQLELHPQKVVIRSLSHGIDFLGYVLFLHHRLMRSSTSRRMKCRLSNSYENFLQGKINATDMDQQLQSYLGLLSHANQHNLAQVLKNSFWVRKGGFSI